jgi:DNA-directed RNA polymerase subunit M/transcription elongation factor TFIIS
MTCPRCTGTLIPDENDDRDELTIAEPQTVEYVCLACGRRFDEAALAALEQQQKFEEARTVDDRSKWTPDEWDVKCWPMFGDGRSVNAVSHALGYRSTHNKVAQSHARWEQRNERTGGLPDSSGNTPPEKRAEKRTIAEIDAILWPQFVLGVSVATAAYRAKMNKKIAERSHLRWQTGTPATSRESKNTLDRKRVERARVAALTNMVAQMTLREYFALGEAQRAGVYAFAQATFGGAS